MWSPWTRASGRTLAALICMGLGAVGCEVSSSADDRKARIAKLEEIERDNLILAEIEQEERLARQTFMSRYQGRIEPGVGCDICPDLCKVADLRLMAASEFQQAYRQAVFDMMESRDHLLMDVAAYEQERLYCIARREPTMRDALLQLFDPRETPMVRYYAAVDVARLGFGTSEPKRVLHEVAQGTGLPAGMARVMLETWDQRPWATK